MAVGFWSVEPVGADLSVRLGRSGTTRSMSWKPDRIWLATDAARPSQMDMMNRGHSRTAWHSTTILVREGERQ
jgi:hypothetical protein